MFALKIHLEKNESGIQDIIIREDSIIGLIGIKEAVLARFWRIYRDTFNETITKEPRNELILINNSN